ncbi:MAG TPA: phage terminase large subunit [Caulobacteraceae bacterium]|nr:phage terminase large subunit [Caulobacteraceae bacterium]
MSALVTPAEYRAILRTNLTAFTERVFATISPGDKYDPNWHVEVMTEALRQVHFGETRRLLITVPPRHGKSITTAVAFPAWGLGLDPCRKFIVASYGGELASKHARDFRMVIDSPWYRTLFPRTVQSPKRAVEFEYETAENGSRRAVSLGGAITGLGADTLIIDDLMKAGDANSAVERQKVKDFFDQTLFSRLNDKRSGSIIAIQQRLHEDDLAAYLIEKGDFKHINLRSIAEENETWELGGGRRFRRRQGEPLFEAREPLHVLEETRTTVGATTFQAQYQQDPTAPNGNLIRLDRLSFYDEPPEPERTFYRVQSWDVAVTATPQSDYSVCTTWGYDPPNWYLLDLSRVRMEYPDLLAHGRELRRRWKPDLLLVEKSGAGRPFFDDMRRDQLRATPERDDPPWMIVGWQPKTDKISRMAGQAEKLQSGLILLPRSAPFLAVLKAELQAFPGSRYDDQVDSISQFGEWIARGRFHRGLDEKGYPERERR